MPAPSQPAGRRRQATSNAILGAASELIAEKGADGFTMTEIAQRAGVNRALLYHYFKDRDNLVFEAVRHIVSRYEEMAPSAGPDQIERDIRMHIEHPEIARFLFHLLLTGRPLPRLSQRVIGAIDALEAAKQQHAPSSSFDPTFGVIGGWLVQLAWSCAREELARHLGLSVEEADARFINHLRVLAGLTQRALGVSPS